VPFVEELTYRGLGYTLLERFGRWPAILAVGLLFGLAHGLLASLPVIAFFGCVLAWLRARTDSVVPGMLLHALFNLAALVVAVAI
jgi:membrane protease YdiL (CAAX protease family)